MPSVSGNGGESSVFARVSLSAQILDWNSFTRLPFDVIDYDPAGLWDATNHWFAAKAAGWYEVAAYGGPISVASFASSGTAELFALIIGAGNNISVFIAQHEQVTSGEWLFPPLFGHTHLDVGDTVDLESTLNGSVLLGLAFSLRMVTAD